MRVKFSREACLISSMEVWYLFYLSGQAIWPCIKYSWAPSFLRTWIYSSFAFSFVCDESDTLHIMRLDKISSHLWSMKSINHSKCLSYYVITKRKQYATESNSLHVPWQGLNRLFSVETCQIPFVDIANLVTTAFWDEILPRANQHAPFQSHDPGFSPFRRCLRSLQIVIKNWLRLVSHPFIRWN